MIVNGASNCTLLRDVAPLMKKETQWIGQQMVISIDLKLLTKVRHVRGFVTLRSQTFLSPAHIPKSQRSV